MRGDDKKRLNSGRNSTSNWPSSQAPPYTAPYRERPTSATLYNPAVPTTQQSYDFETRSPMNQPVMTSMYNQPAQYPPNPNYSQVPLVNPTNESYAPRATQLQPDVIYTQGPSGYIQSTPVEYTIQQPQYHQSSV
ncbi:hypothetical protein WR25_05095 isoform B [Diploscapter pachys]|uniref:Uncharacterized protein n=1 Tax=Diploscapter pachys TaxID=2018661 RepID=A0A2A2J809_9BILA|nr:hypothetical protein WR25_05095 isoform A [Diploscapter pachys]PAV57788.1 hypothetical protein WR25_05095 isoform B [Diploscapter pachys]